MNILTLGVDKVDENKVEESLCIDGFSLNVEKLVSEGSTYMDAILDVCEKRDIEIETVGKLVKSTLLERLTHEATVRHLLNTRNESVEIEC
ncbi:MAG: late promoter transcription accessory protein [Ghiorsea sp.]